jgi:hypothetical protein
VDIRQKLEDFQRDQAKKDQKKPAATATKAAPKGGAGVAQPQQSMDEVTDPLAGLKAVIQDKKTLYTHNIAFVGVPVIRLGNN